MKEHKCFFCAGTDRIDAYEEKYGEYHMKCLAEYNKDMNDNPSQDLKERIDRIILQLTAAAPRHLTGSEYEAIYRFLSIDNKAELKIPAEFAANPEQKELEL